ncbi:hypothetical protein HYN48_13140 [Flavobacterium magnum]|uniref:Uncharacterized protein n=1 Tax=Flavobacterium magnum TaxID=2162713 RepID=A0A2S0RGZ6_9FLAO|nr:hypothetical protein [Flavobacterium magnum]AWA30944.1 hypothetical protein HYN48_13140 [Flavobacterium magnum]
MKEFQDTIFISEILLQSKIALRAFERLHATHENFDRLEVWCSIQSILVSTGNISKILWSGKYRLRSKRLREVLKVQTDNILLDREFRNYFEHYDEKIEERFENGANGVYIDLAMNPSFRGDFGGNDNRGYNSFDNSLVFRGKRLDLNKVFGALIEIRNNCKRHVLDFP